MRISLYRPWVIKIGWNTIELTRKSYLPSDILLRWWSTCVGVFSLLSHFNYLAPFSSSYFIFLCLFFHFRFPSYLLSVLCCLITLSFVYPSHCIHTSLLFTSHSVLLVSLPPGRPATMHATRGADVIWGRFLVCLQLGTITSLRRWSLWFLELVTATWIPQGRRRHCIGLAPNC